MEELEAEIGVDLLAEQRLVRLEADVAPGVEVELGERAGQRRSAGVIRRRRKVARALDDVLVAERRAAPAPPAGRSVCAAAWAMKRAPEAATTLASSARRDISCMRVIGDGFFRPGRNPEPGESNRG